MLMPSKINTSNITKDYIQKNWNLKTKKFSTIQKANKLTNTFTFLQHFPSYIEKQASFET